MTIELVNTADTTWVDEAGDRTTVHGWILDENGQRIVEDLPPGRYALVAELRDLALTSPLGALVLYASPPETA